MLYVFRDIHISLCIALLNYICHSWKLIISLDMFLCLSYAFVWVAMWHVFSLVHVCLHYGLFVKHDYLLLLGADSLLLSNLQGLLNLKIAECYLSLNEKPQAISFFYKGMVTIAINDGFDGLHPFSCARS